ncbi:MAG: type I DNA topoisomerase [Deltaproteobacteria bacterium]|nr:type I DNA topoisomerase [Deltaproteobacteria bacterium]
MASRGNTLVVVESPAKAKTIKKYLGASYQVLASKGHVWDLPKKFGIDIEKGFQETYEVIEGKEKTLKEIKEAAKDADAIMLATDPDREGEAIAFHLAQELKGAKKPTRRVLFTEITKRGVKEGVDNPRDLDARLYDAQRCRRVLDRIVGYDVSSLVWSKLAFGLSAGRVQSVALRLIVDREREIEAFVPEEFWNLAARLVGKVKPGFTAKLHTWDGKAISKDKIGDGDTAHRVQSELAKARYKVAKVTRAERQRRAPAPYTTSKLQQDAANILRFPAKRTMQVAQGLYEGVELGKELGSVGLITYMRTDSVRVSDDALTAVRAYIGETFTQAHLPGSPNVYKSRKSAQEAHEAIRPTSLDLPPEKVAKWLKPEQLKLYRLIWNRFVASQMTPAVYDQTTADIDANIHSNGVEVTHQLRATGRVLKFSGWLEAYAKRKEPDEEVTELAGEEDGEEKAPESRPARDDGKDDDTELPALEEGEVLSLVTPPGVSADQKFTQPPPRFNEGSLVRALEERGIGRPSTYAEIISKVQARDYVEKPDGRTFKPTELGKMVVDGLVEAALDFMDPEFTANMEEELELVEQGKLPREKLLDSFYKRFKKQLEKAKKLKRWTPEPSPTNETCDLCGKPMLKRWSKRGWFLGCSGYPKCKGTRPLEIDAEGNLSVAKPQLTQYLCDVCGRPMALRSGRYGQFLSCTGYPECKNAQPVPLGVKCPKCKTGELIEIRPAKRGGRTFYGCSNYKHETIKCDFKLWQRPIPEPCPDCGAAFLVRGGNKARPMIQCVTEGCGYKREPTEEELAGGTTPRLEEQPADATV